MTALDRAWLAGVFDAHGGVSFTVYVEKSGRKKGTRRGVLMAYVDCNRPGLIEEIRRIVGSGSLVKDERKGQGLLRTLPTRRTRFIVSARLARAMLIDIRPLLRIRRDRVDQMLLREEAWAACRQNSGGQDRQGLAANIRPEGGST